MPVTTEWAFDYDGFSFNDDDFGVIKVEGLDPPDIRSDIVEKAEDHGSYVFAQYLSHRLITFEGDLMTDADFESRITELRGAFVPRTTAAPLSFLIGDTEKVVFCKPLRTAFPIDRAYSYGDGRWTVQLVAEDPRIYSAELQSGTLTPFTANGIGFDVAFPVDFGGGEGGSMGMVNAGVFGTPPITRIDGPVTNPKVTNVTVDKFLRVDITLAVGEFLILDHAARTVMLNGESSRYSQLTTDSEWWNLEAGSNTIRFDGSNTGGATQVIVTWRDAWL